MALNHVSSRNLRVGQKLVLAKQNHETEEPKITNGNEDLEEDDSLDISIET